ncbi:YidC/Oxa1 family membrane protein insertase [Streptomyces reniochalinae]|uniref:Membrane protein insertase YidC n=1 Tax=Streptomyces reniochalinae TaxID=2250578 RepID=A0A367EAI8_9ACTN|nr:membrane protein insertase YidC [Streptomyces reniochalinae]RCG15076.1 membrane protein insertase YidC [Streptomyces reniochalinae]
MSSFAAVVAFLSDALEPVFSTSATAAAIVVCTLCVRLALHPLARAAVRGERGRAAPAPRVAELQRKHRRDPDLLRREMSALHAREGVSPVAGCLPTLLQLPVFFVMYHVSTTDDALLEHTLLGAPLGGRWADALGHGGPLGAQGLVYAGLFALTLAVASWTYARTRRAAVRTAGTQGATGGAGVDRTVPRPAALTRLLPLLSFATVVTVAVVPLAAALYVVTSMTWTAVERAALRAGSVPGREVPERKRRPRLRSST